MKLLFITQLLLAAGVIYVLLQPNTDSVGSVTNGSTFKISSNPGHSTPDQNPKTDQKAQEPKNDNPKTPDNHQPEPKPQDPTPNNPQPKPKDPTSNDQPHDSKDQSKPLLTLDVQIQYESNDGPADNEISWIYKTKEEHETLCQQKNQRPIMLCRLGLKNHCQRKHISEALSYWWMICPIYTANTAQTEHLYELHNNFRNYARSYGINFQTVETIFPGQKFQLTEPNNQPHDLQYHADWIFAMRENLVNVGIKHLPADWEFMAWIDQHIFWLDPYWFEKCIWLFSHKNIVHMLESNDFWSAQNTTDYHLEGFGKLYNLYGNRFANYDPRQCGLAWGMRREIFDELGGLLDICIGTKCDLYQNYAYTGQRYTLQATGTEYVGMLSAWQDHAIQVYKKSLGYLPSKVVHFRHCFDNCKTSEYHLHVQALMTYRYNPKTDLNRDEEGRLTLINNLPLAKKLWELYGGATRSLRRRRI